MALWVDQFTGFDPVTQVLARGGHSENCSGVQNYGSAGTIFVKTTSHTYGDLRVDQGTPLNKPTPSTSLPTMGESLIGTVTVDGDDAQDLWITPQDPDYVFSVGVLGMWARIDGQDYEVIGETQDRRSLLLDGAAGTVEVGDEFVGVYKFDTVTVKGRAQLDVLDRLDAGILDVAADSSLFLYDYDHPVIVSIDPAAGTGLSSGDAVTFTVDATDNDQIAQVRFLMDGADHTATQAPYAWSTFVPTVTTPSTVTLTVTVVDATGNATTQGATYNVTPLAAVAAPVTAVPGCPSDGDWVAPGTDVVIPVSAIDDVAIDRLSLWVDGVEVDRRGLLGTASASADLVWPVPVDAVPGTVHQVRAQASDFAADVGFVDFSLVIAPAGVLVGDQALETSVDGTDVVLGPGVYSVSEPLSPSSLTLLAGARMVPASTDTVELDVSGAMVVQCGADIDLEGRAIAAARSTWPSMEPHPPRWLRPIGRPGPATAAWDR